MASLVSESTIAELPLNGRNYVDLTLLQPGITQQTQENAGQGIAGTMYSSDGAPMRSNIVMLDGTLTINSGGLNASSIAGTTLGMDGVKEYKVITNLAGAQYFSGHGRQTTIVSRSGTNRLTGDVFEYLRNSVLDARNYFDPSTSILGTRIPGFKRNQFGAALGGPLKRNKTYFFANYEGLRQSTGNPLYVPIDSTMPPECWTPGLQFHQPLDPVDTATPARRIQPSLPGRDFADSWPPVNSNGGPNWLGAVNPQDDSHCQSLPLPQRGEHEQRRPVGRVRLWPQTGKR